MSGIKNLANAIMNDPGFSKQAGIAGPVAKSFLSGRAGGEDCMQMPNEKGKPISATTKAPSKGEY